MKPHIILIGYKKRSGKDTAAEMLSAEFTKRTGGRYSQILHFARGIKNETCRLFDITPQELDENKELFRPFLQWYGTDYIRKFRKDDNHWVRRVAMMIANASSPLVIIPDFRFKIEKAFLVEMFGESYVHTIRMVGKIDPIDLHISEQELEGYPFDSFISNGGGLDTLKTQVAVYCEDSAWFNNYVNNLNSGKASNV